MEALVEGKIEEGILSYGRVCPELQLGFYNVHDDQIMHLSGGQLLIQEHSLKDASLQEIGKMNWWLVYENMHICPLSKFEITNMVNELLLKKRVAKKFIAWKANDISKGKPNF